MGNVTSTIYAGIILMLYNISEKYNEFRSKDYSDNSKKENLLDENSNFKNADIENQNVSKENSNKSKENQFSFFGKGASKKEDNTGNQYKLLKNSDDNELIEEKKEDLKKNNFDDLKKEIKHTIIEFDTEEDAITYKNENKKKLIEEDNFKSAPEEMLDFGNHDSDEKDENSKKPKDENKKLESFDDLRNEILLSDVEE
jgi:hypothetical protein